MSKQIEALEALNEFDRYFTSMNGVDVDARISVPRDEWRALRDKINESLAEPEQEPVAWIGAGGTIWTTKKGALKHDKNAKPLYISPQPREWQELSEEEKTALFKNGSYPVMREDWNEEYKAISVALRAKNEVKL